MQSEMSVSLESIGSEVSDKMLATASESVSAMMDEKPESRANFKPSRSP